MYTAGVSKDVNLYYYFILREDKTIIISGSCTKEGYDLLTSSINNITWLEDYSIENHNLKTITNGT